MASYHRKSHGGIVFSLALHVALIGSLAVSVDMPWRKRQPPAPAPIQAEIIDAKAFEAEINAKEEAARAAQDAERERLAKEQAERERVAKEQVERERVAKEQAERERVAKEQAERERVAQEQAERERVAKEQAERERIAKEQAERERIAKEQAERERLAKEQAERERLAKEQAERERIAREAERVLAEERRRAEEAAQAAAARQTARDAYVRLITNHIEKHWSRPPNAQPGLRCVVNVRQIPSGDIINFSVSSCNGDEIVRRSIEAAVTLSSPLPRPSDPSVFERDLEVIFAPVLQ